MLPTSAWKRGVSGVADARTTSRAIALAAWSLLLAAGPASANGAMSLALGTFGWDLWGSYVLAIVLFEALFLGRCLRVPLGKALIYSLGANLLTAVVGGSVSGIFSYGFLGVFATRLNPNPFGQTLLLFTLFASLSAPVEAWVSSGAPSTLGGTSRRGRTLALALAVHLLAVPLGLAILLLPVRPYGGLESQVAGERQSIQREVVRALNQYVADHESLPPDRTYGEVLERLRPQLGSFVDEP
ncbi:MAG TPA: hypothetical protein VK689_12400, partial [Armatimonadota bacterium]|nr:hypothetical protein [Armatimonadota bacterium]